VNQSLINKLEKQEAFLFLKKKSGLSAYKQRKVIKALRWILRPPRRPICSVSIARQSTATTVCSERPSMPTRAGKSLALVGIVECDECYLALSAGVVCLGRASVAAAPGSSRVFGIFERGGAVFTEIVPDVKAKTLQAIIRGKVSPDSVVMTDGWQSYDGLVDVGYDKHFRIKKYRKEGSPSPTARYT
jgi:transposase